MAQLTDFTTFLVANASKLAELSLEHIGLTLLSLLLACLLAIPLGFWIARHPRAAGPVLGVAGILQTIPSIALLGTLIPLLGIGLKPAIFALLLYAILPILRNTYTGIRGVDAAVVEAARGMGMTPWQILRQVELPLALPVLLAGVRTAAVINVGVATLAAYIGAGGLGEFIFGGIALNNNAMILAGALPAALLALLFDQGIAMLQGQRRWQPGWLVLLPLVGLLAWQSPASSGELSAAFDPEFSDRADGLPSIQRKYAGLHFNTLILNAGLLYRAVAEGEVDIISGYSTDGRVRAYDLAVLTDDQHAFPPYQCAPLVNGATAQRHPELLAALQRLDGQLTDSLMTAMNYQVDYQKQAPAAVAKAYLQSRGWWQTPRSGSAGSIIIGSKLFTEQYILVELFRQLIEGYTDLKVVAKPGLGGTKICYDALRLGDIDLYPEYTGTGFQVLLSPPEEVVAKIFTDADAVYQYVKTACDQRDDVQWLPPLGFNNTYALMTRQQLATEKGWHNISDLRSAAN